MLPETAHQNGHAEICEGCQPVLVALQDRNRGLEETIRRQASALGTARRLADPETRAREHERWQEVAEEFDHWRVVCRHPRSRFSAKRFHQALPFFDAHGRDLCHRAIDGAAFDPFKTKRKNGTTKRHDDWSLIFRDDDKFEEFCNRAPLTHTPNSKGSASEQSRGSAPSG